MKSELTSCLPNGRPAKDDGIKYSLVDPAGLEQAALSALDNETEEDFCMEVEVVSNDGSEDSSQNAPVHSGDREIFVARFTTHASWGLRAKLESDKHGAFALYLEFCRDADEQE
jgi:hypothetical protein